MFNINLHPLKSSMKVVNKKIVLLLIFFVIFLLLLCLLLALELTTAKNDNKQLITELEASLNKKNRIEPHQNVVAADTFAMKDIKWVGYFKKSNDFWGLLLLPNGLLLQVKKNFVIGKEQGLIITLNPDEMIIRLPNGELIKKFC